MKTTKVIGKISIALIITVFCSCVTSNILPLKNVSYSPTNLEQLNIYYKNDSIPYNYIKFTQITMKVPRNINREKLNIKIREEASKIGATGVIIESRKDKGLNYWWLNRESTIKLIAIRKIESSEE